MMFSDLGPRPASRSQARASTRHFDQDAASVVSGYSAAGEAGVPGFEAVSWQAIAASAQTPRPILDKLNAEITAVLAMPEVKEQTLKYGFLPSKTAASMSSRNS